MSSQPPAFDRYASLRYANDSPMRRGDVLRWPDGRIQRIVDLLGAPSISDSALVLVMQDGYLETQRLWDLKPARLISRSAEDEPPPDVAEIERRAGEGDANARFHLAWLLRQAERVQRDALRAASLYRQAAEQGHPEALCDHAVLLDTKLYGEPDPAAALRCRREAARLGSARAMDALSGAYRHGHGVAKDEAAMRRWRTWSRWTFTLGVDWEAEWEARRANARETPPMEDAQALYERALLQIADRALPSPARDGIVSMEGAAALGHAPAQLALAELCLRGDLVRPELPRFHDLLGQAAAQSYPPALYRLGAARLAGTECAVDVEAAQALWERAAGLGDGDAQFALGDALESGAAMPADERRARALFTLAAAQGHVEGSYRLGRMREVGSGGPDDLPGAFAAYDVAARAGHPDASFRAVRLALAGHGDTPDPAPALARLKALLAEPHPQAERLWARIHEFGLHGVPRDLRIASYWYGVSGGLAGGEGAFHRGRLLLQIAEEDGPDLIQARLILHWAADQGSEAARELLETLPPASSEGHNLRGLYHALADREPTQAWSEIVQAHAADLAETRRQLRNIRQRPDGRRGWPECGTGELYDLYAAQRLSDQMLSAWRGGAWGGFEGLPMDRARYVDFWQGLGFEPREPRRFHPILCEVVKVIQSDDGDEAVHVVETLWPALMLGPMVFVRAGVRVRAPRARLVAGIADEATMYWTYTRAHRGTEDPSLGWGHNSQWSTSFRRDLVLADRFAWNVDAFEPNDLEHAKDGDSDLEGLSLCMRRELLRHRSLTNAFPPLKSVEFYPYKDMLVEARDPRDAPLW
jgi:TPR repeat protein